MGVCSLLNVHAYVRPSVFACVCVCVCVRRQPQAQEAFSISCRPIYAASWGGGCSQRRCECVCASVTVYVWLRVCVCVCLCVFVWEINSMLSSHLHFKRQQAANQLGSLSLSSLFPSPSPLPLQLQLELLQDKTTKSSQQQRPSRQCGHAGSWAKRQSIDAGRAMASETATSQINVLLVLFSDGCFSSFPARFGLGTKKPRAFNKKKKKRKTKKTRTGKYKILIYLQCPL